MLVLASLDATYELLRNLSTFQHLTTVVSGLTMLSPDEFAGRGRPLFLRDVISFKVTSCKVRGYARLT